MPIFHGDSGKWQALCFSDNACDWSRQRCRSTSQRRCLGKTFYMRYFKKWDFLPTPTLPNLSSLGFFSPPFFVTLIEWMWMNVNVFEITKTPGVDYVQKKIFISIEEGGAGEGVALKLNIWALNIVSIDVKKKHFFIVIIVGVEEDVKNMDAFFILSLFQFLVYLYTGIKFKTIIAFQNNFIYIFLKKIAFIFFILSGYLCLLFPVFIKIFSDFTQVIILFISLLPYLSLFILSLCVWGRVYV